MGAAPVPDQNTEPVQTMQASPPVTGRVVVIDPGHGGAKLGTRNRAGALEKNITLAVSQSMARALREAGVDVVMTREDDQDISLGQRVVIANDRNAAVFVSIHANSSPVEDRRGSEVYILAATPSDADAAEVAGREDAADIRPSGRSNGNDLGGILDDLALSAAHEGSSRLGQEIEDRLAGVDDLKPARGLRQAMFAVLRGAKMPAVLVELGYLTQREQGEALARYDVQDAAGKAIAEGVLRYLAEARARQEQPP